MQTSRLQAVTARFSPLSLRSTFRRSSSASSSPSRDSTYSTTSALSSSSSPVSAINTIIYRQPSIVGLQEERENFSQELDVLEPRPIVYWGSVEERMGTL